MRITAVIILAFLIISAASFTFGQNKFVYDVKDKRDPFVPLVDKDGNILPEFRPTTNDVELKLEGILWSDKGNSYAIISGAPLQAGDTIGDYKVIKIERTKVTLSKGQEIVAISLGSEEE